MVCLVVGYYMANPMTRREFKDLLEKVLCGEPVYIVDTGTRVRVTRYSKDRSYRTKKDNCSIEFLETPNKKSIDKCDRYDVEVSERTNSQTQQIHYEVNVSASIDIKNLRAVPYKTRAADVLFGSDKETKNGKV